LQRREYQIHGGEVPELLVPEKDTGQAVP